MSVAVAKSPVARDLMVRRLITLKSDTDVFDAIDILLKNSISGAPVLDGEGNYLGVFTERSTLSLLMSAAYDSSPTTEIRAFIDRDAPTIDPDLDLLSMMQIFLEGNVRRLPVLDADGRLIGQVSRRDVLKHTASMIRTTKDKQSALLYLSSLMERSEHPFQ